MSLGYALQKVFGYNNPRDENRRRKFSGFHELLLCSLSYTRFKVATFDYGTGCGTARAKLRIMGSLDDQS